MKYALFLLSHLISVHTYLSSIRSKYFDCNKFFGITSLLKLLQLLTGILSDVALSKNGIKKRNKTTCAVSRWLVYAKVVITGTRRYRSEQVWSLQTCFHMFVSFFYFLEFLWQKLHSGSIYY